tara:strand:+ start:630 stop:824 length:195 start_codon:yes stop_codon:yes gene_type:complete
MLELKLSKNAKLSPSAVFTQTGRFVMAGHVEECEPEALRIRGLFCLVDRGRAVIRFDFEDMEDN